MAGSKIGKLIRRLLGWLLFAVLIGAPTAYWYTREPEIEVTAIILKRGRIEQTIAAFASGTVEPKQSSTVAPETIGKVTAVRVKEGDRVNQGDVLIELDCRQQAFQVTQAETRIRQTETALELLKKQHKNDSSRIPTLKRARDLAEQEFQKDKNLYEREDVGSESMVNLSEVNFNQVHDTYKALNDLVQLYPLRIQEAETGLEAIAIMRDQAEISLDWTKIRAPFAGLVADVYVDVGESVGGGLGGAMSGGTLGAGLGAGAGMGGMGTVAGGGASGMPMASPLAVALIVDDSDLYVKAPFDEATFGQIESGQKAKITVDAYRDKEFPGRVASVSSTVSRNLDLSRTFEVDILIEEGKEKLIPGMSADVTIVADEKEDVLYVPTEALIREEEGYVIINGRAERRKVKIGIGNWLEREVLEGLREGEELITSVGLKELRPGIKVRVVEALKDQ